MAYERKSQRLQSISWIMMLLSMLIDTTHSRSFPSYNFFIGAFCCYSAYQFVENISKEKKASNTRIFSSLLLLLFFSIIIDGIYSVIWGSEILDGSVQIKFSFSLLIVNMFVKVVAICYVSFAIVHFHHEDNHVGSMLNDSADIENKKAVHSTVSPEISDAGDTVQRRNSSPRSDGLESPMVHFPPDSLFAPKRSHFWTPSP